MAATARRHCPSTLPLSVAALLLLLVTLYTLPASTHAATQPARGATATRLQQPRGSIPGTATTASSKKGDSRLLAGSQAIDDLIHAKNSPDKDGLLEEEPAAPLAKPNAPAAKKRASSKAAVQAQHQPATATGKAAASKPTTAKKVAAPTAASALPRTAPPAPKSKATQKQQQQQHNEPHVTALAAAAELQSTLLDAEAAGGLGEDEESAEFLDKVEAFLTGLEQAAAAHAAEAAEEESEGAAEAVDASASAGDQDDDDGDGATAGAGTEDTADAGDAETAWTVLEDSEASTQEGAASDEAEPAPAVRAPAAGGKKPKSKSEAVVQKQGEEADKPEQKEPAAHKVEEPQHNKQEREEVVAKKHQQQQQPTSKHQLPAPQKRMKGYKAIGKHSAGEQHPQHSDAPEQQDQKHGDKQPEQKQENQLEQKQEKPLEQKKESKQQKQQVQLLVEPPQEQDGGSQQHQPQEDTKSGRSDKPEQAEQREPESPEDSYEHSSDDGEEQTDKEPSQQHDHGGAHARHGDQGDEPEGPQHRSRRHGDDDDEDHHRPGRPHHQQQPPRDREPAWRHHGGGRRPRGHPERHEHAPAEQPREHGDGDEPAPRRPHVGTVCPTGSFVVDASKEEASSPCTACPKGRTTHGPGAESVDDCEVCLPGFGGERCTACRAGSWSAGGRADDCECTPCDDGETTRSAGAASVHECGTVLTADGSEQRPFCTYAEFCWKPWETVRQVCATQLCKASGFARGAWLSDTGSMCGARIPDAPEEAYVYVVDKDTRSHVAADFGKYDASRITALCSGDGAAAAAAATAAAAASATIA